MVIGMLLAGGVGRRVGASLPKQFLEIDGKPIILYSLETMEKHPLIDAIEIVCVESFIPEMWEMVKKAGLTKVKWIVAGGETGQDSTRNGIYALRDKMDKDDILLIQMSAFPLSTEKLMTNCIELARKKGNGCTARPILYAICNTRDKKSSVEFIDRDTVMLCTMPYAFNYGEVLPLYERAYAEGRGITGNAYTNTLYCEYGMPIYFTEDTATNLKITTEDDLALMKTYLKVLKEEQSQN